MPQDEFSQFARQAQPQDEFAQFARKPARTASSLPVGEIPLTSYGAATLQGFANIGKGVNEALAGVYQAVRHPIETSKAVLASPSQLATQATQVPGAIRDIKASADPTGTFLKVAGQTAGEVGGQAVVAAATPSAFRAIRRLPKLIPSTGRAGAAAERVMAATKNEPVSVSAPGKVALEIDKLASSGGKLPKVIRDFIRRTTDPEKGPLTYEEARSFYQNANRLSLNELNNLNPNLQRLVGKFTHELGKSVAETTKQAGTLEDYQSFMREYHQAMKMHRQLEVLKKYGMKAALGAAGAGAGGYAAHAGYELYSGK